MMTRLFLAGLIALTMALPAFAGRFTIAAASDLRYALDEIVAAYREGHPDHDVTLIYGSSGKMTTQILNGAPFDVFFSADIAFPERLAEAGFTASEPEVYAIGRIVLWSRRLDASGLSLQDLVRPDIRRVAIAQPAHAPYGQRAREALQAAGVWEAVQGKLVFGENIAHAAQMAQSGAADVGIIALSLAVFPDLAVRPHLLIDDALHQPLTQGFVITRRAADNPAAWAFADFMHTETAREIMRRYGFVLPDGAVASESG
ncbi:MAG TPA: molybdate ABC transporter substrate-binding protein [Azoarcus taiwanensis]|nr:molybdate ABC transporter substrate-binding protein [Azoarcus taiwanensis]